jgi:CRISPR system Cascade subunit CasA
VDGEEPVQIQGDRSDFQGSYIQFLIGLFQTACPPVNDREWRRRFESPPTPEECKKFFEPFESYFEVFGEEIRFMQDPRVQDREAIPVGRLLLEMPGENAEKNNTDHFLKRGTVSRICPRCAAVALFTLQTNASFGGAGHRVGLRGGGPMTTLIKGDTIWKQIWLNVLDTEKFSQLGNTSLTGPESIFPWSKQGLALAGTQVTPQDVHPNQMFWGTPRRIFLQPEEKDGICDLCGSHSQTMVQSYCTEKGGIVYTGGWMHTLSPYFVDKKGGVPGAIHVQPGGISYRNWLGVMQANPDKTGTTSPALVVQVFKASRLRSLGLKSGNIVPLWAFGYDMDKAKARCYYESFLPIPQVNEDDILFFEAAISQWIKAASYCLWALKQCVKQAWYTTPKNHPGDISVLDLRFWKETELSFYNHMGELASHQEFLQDSIPLNKKWLTTLQNTCFSLFDEYSQYDQIDVADPKRIALARRSLTILTHPATKQVADILGLPLPAEKRSKASKKKEP